MPGRAWARGGWRERRDGRPRRLRVARRRPRRDVPLRPRRRDPPSLLAGRGLPHRRGRCARARRPSERLGLRITGQPVTKGQELLVVEAMKMENALRAPRDGVVRSVAARPGDMVSPGLVLVELE
ncbi:MAG: hypothetical protein DMF82_08010 [Acidobacteria bacterium]|nr:MAG: hypothetical protein DMF82_08010 [Acidobacteriota bacterium]